MSERTVKNTLIHDLLDERIAMFAALANWRRRWNEAFAERFGPYADPMSALIPMDDAAMELIRKTDGTERDQTAQPGLRKGHAL